VTPVGHAALALDAERLLEGRRNEKMSDQSEGAAADVGRDVGRDVQQGLNQAGDATEQFSQMIRDRPIPSMLIAIAIGYLLGKTL
jgi:ElaB/YqjD/DUF883 family membrane-anchored ribosome-binding protein